MIVLQAFENQASMASNLASHVYESMHSALSSSYLVLPGGSTPKQLYAYLEELDWSNHAFNLLASDERCLEAEDIRRNENAIFPIFSRFNNIRKHSLYQNSQDPDRLLEELQRDYSSPFPVHCCVLGMGLDGHFASIFPEQSVTVASNLKDSLFSYAKKCDEDFFRISLHWPVFFHAHKVVLMIHGEQKLQVLRKWLNDEDQTRPVVRLVKSREVQVYWSP